MPKNLMCTIWPNVANLFWRLHNFMKYGKGTNILKNHRGSFEIGSVHVFDKSLVKSPKNFLIALINW